MQFSFDLVHFLNNSWCDWECTGVLWCLSYEIQRKGTKEIPSSWESRYHY